MKKILSKIVDIILILLIIYLSFRLLQKRGIIDSKIDKIDQVPPFTSTDIYGKEINNDIFKNYDLTIVSIWSPK